MKGRRHIMIPAGTANVVSEEFGEKMEERTDLESQRKTPLELRVGNVDRQAIFEPVRSGDSDDDDNLKHS